MIKTIFLDLDDTLLDFSKGEAVALRQALEERGVPATKAVLERYHVINLAHWEKLERGELTREQVVVRRFEQLFEELGVTCSSAEVCACYEQYLSQQHEQIPGALELLETLAPRYDLYLASNGAAVVQYPRLQASGIRPFFKGLFISEEIGADKPSLAYFERCFAAIPDFKREEAVIIGDSLTSDMKGGIQAGLRTIWFNPHHRPGRPPICPDHEVDTLAAIPPLLKTL